MQESSLLDEDKFIGMAEKLADEQKGFYNQKKQHEVMIK
jgi:hypothetical protein